MTPLTFQSQPSGREVAMLGSICVGAVMAIEWSGRSRAQWLCFLPIDGCFLPTWKRAPNIDAAKDAIGRAVTDWLECAGLRRSEAA